MKKRGETITYQQLLTEEQDHILLAIKYWEVKIASYLDECDDKAAAREQLAAWQQAKKDAGI